MNADWWYRLVASIFLIAVTALDPWGPNWFVVLNGAVAGFLLCTVVIDWIER